MRAGRLRHLCELQEELATKVPGGGRETTWKKIDSIWVEIGMPSGRTEPVADRLETEVSAEILARPLPDIRTGMRLFHIQEGATYKIEAALRNNQGDLLRLLCSNVITP